MGCMQMKNKKNLYILVGAPGAGKSTYIRTNTMADRDIVISRDIIRFSHLLAHEDYFAHEDIVWKEFIERIQKAIDDSNGPENIWCDSTCITTKAREKLLNALRLKNVKSKIAVVVHPSLATHFRQNNKRNGRSRVPLEAIKNIYNSYIDPKEDKKYPFDRVIYYRMGE